MGLRNQVSMTCTGVAGAQPAGSAPRGREPTRRGPWATLSKRGERGIQIFGNTQGLKASQVRALERLYRRRLPAGRLITQ